MRLCNWAGVFKSCSSGYNVEVEHKCSQIEQLSPLSSTNTTTFYLMFKVVKSSFHVKVAKIMGTDTQKQSDCLNPTCACVNGVRIERNLAQGLLLTT